MTEKEAYPSFVIERMSSSMGMLAHLVELYGPMTNHEIHDLLGGNPCITLTCLKGLLHEAETRKLLKFNSDNKTWSV